MFFVQALIVLMFMNSTATTIDIDRIVQQAQQDAQYWFEQFSSPLNIQDQTLWHSDYKDPIANGLIQLNASNADASVSIIDDVLHFTQDHDMPFVWTISGHNDIATVSKHFADRGLIEETGFLMQHNLQNICLKSIPELIIKPIVADEIDDWFYVLNTSFGEYDAHFTGAYKAIVRSNLNLKKALYVAGYIDNKIISIGTLFLHSEFAYIANIATLPEYRGRGIASALTNFLVQTALENGSTLALLEAGSAARLYEKIGFCKIMNLHQFIYLPQTRAYKQSGHRLPFIFWQRR